MNHEYLREYLYRERPFNNVYAKLNKMSNGGNLNHKQINLLKNTLRECGDKKKKRQLGLGDEKAMGKEKYEHCHKMKEYKKKIEDEIDE